MSPPHFSAPHKIDGLTESDFIFAGVPPLSGDRIDELPGQLEGWKVGKEHHLTKAYTFPGFAEALAFVNRVGAIAEQQQDGCEFGLSGGLGSVDALMR